MASLKHALASDSLSTNISNKIYVRSLRNGKVQKIVREVYLRDDIPCSSKLCQACLSTAPRTAANTPLPFVLSGRPATTAAYPQGHYLIPDADVLIGAMDLFEQAASFRDVVVLQTVLDEVRTRSLPLYHRLIGLAEASEDKRFYVFFNEFRRETHVVREPDETVPGRSARAVRRAVRWYADHLAAAAPAPPAVVMLTNDQEGLRVARQEDGLHAQSLGEYVAGLEDGARLLDMLPETRLETTTTAASAKKADSFYPEYYSLSRMVTGVKAGLLHQGPFSVSTYNYLEGSIRVSAFAKPLIVLGRENINRAVDGDQVVVEVLPRDQWREPSTKILEEEAVARNEHAEDEEGEREGGRQSDSLASERESRALQEQVKKAHTQVGAAKSGSGGAAAQPTARVVGVIRRNWRQYVGHVDPSSTTSRAGALGGRRPEAVFIVPMDRRVPKIRIRTRQAAELLGKRLLVAVDEWDRDSRHPTGHLVRTLGEVETKAAETEALLLEWDVQYRPFPRTVLDCLPQEGHDWRVPESPDDPGWRDREDLRHLLVCSIDPVGCQDIDDALHARDLPNGNIEVGVHIADVSNFVLPATAMDTEAAARGTTVYLVDKRIDMLPTLLGTDLCSLRPRVDRFAFSVIWEMSRADGALVSVRFTKSAIRSRDALSYEEAQLRIDDPARDDELTVAIRALRDLSRLLRQGRLDAGALSLSSPEIKIQMDSQESSDPIDVQTKQLLDTNSLVEEFMLLANVSVAARIHEAFPQTALLRRHAAPPKTNFDELAAQLRVRLAGFELRVDSSRALAESLDRCVDPAEPFFNTLVRILATRCMMSAEYFCAGSLAGPEEFRHYGLASPIYTHFTSPIRRYADLVAHRQLAAAIGYQAPHPSLRSRGRLEAVCRNINIRHRNAQMAGRASVAYYVGQALRGRRGERKEEGAEKRKGKDGEVEDAFVMRVFSNGFVAFVPRFGIESLIRLRDLASPEPEAVFDQETYTLTTTGSRSVKVELFRRIRVRVTDEKDERTGKRGVKMELV